MCCDFLALVLQGAGGGIADTANDANTTQLGINVMIAGLGWQVASLCLFIVACGDLAWAIRQHRPEVDRNTSTLRSSFRFKSFLWGELSQNLHGEVETCIADFR